MMTQDKFEFLKRNLYLGVTMMSNNFFRTETDLIDILLTRCVLMEVYLREQEISDQFHGWLANQNIDKEAYKR
ncbi:hypothetical protein CFV95_008075 [Leptospira interrogans]|uniref:Uncharacterized protein n=2 Tax=Leptospira interrogans TaxID=173 RepID=A0AAV9FSY7_LEPIR|nr:MULTISPECIES: hypothetical protein [Leptospira]KAK2618959.1 hypothetical protein CFV95_008075 [Leptospira interrogans]